MMKELLLEHPKNALILLTLLWLITAIVTFIKALQFTKSTHKTGNVPSILGNNEIRLQANPGEVVNEAIRITKIIMALFTLCIISVIVLIFL